MTGRSRDHDSGWMSQEENLLSGASKFESVCPSRKISFFVKFNFSVVISDWIFFVVLPRMLIPTMF